MTKSKFTIVDVREREHEPLLERFHAGVYTENFPGQREPIDVWKWALFSGEARYRMTLRLALEGDDIQGGVAYEVYPKSRCGLVTYVVVAATARRGGLGKRLRSGAAATMYAEGAPAVFGEVNDPRIPRSYETPSTTWKRLERNQRWGSRVIDTRYIQPSLGPGLDRDRGLCLLLHAGDGPPATHIPGAVVRAFIAELYEIAEGGREPDAELRAMLDIPKEVRLLELVRPPEERGSRLHIEPADQPPERQSSTRMEGMRAAEQERGSKTRIDDGRKSRPRM